MNTSVYCMALHACCYAHDTACIRHRPASISHWPHPQWEQEGVCQRARSILRMNKQTLTITCQRLNLCVEKEGGRREAAHCCHVLYGQAAARQQEGWRWEWTALSRARLWATPRTIESMESPRPEHWSGQPFPSPGIFPTQGSNQVSCISGGFFASWATREGQNTGAGSLSLLQGIFPTQGSNQVSCIAGGFFTSWAFREAQEELRGRESV